MASTPEAPFDAERISNRWNIVIQKNQAVSLADLFHLGVNIHQIRGVASESEICLSLSTLRVELIHYPKDQEYSEAIWLYAWVNKPDEVPILTDEEFEIHPPYVVGRQRFRLFRRGESAYSPLAQSKLRHPGNLDLSGDLQPAYLDPRQRFNVARNLWQAHLTTNI